MIVELVFGLYCNLMNKYVNALKFDFNKDV